MIAVILLMFVAGIGLSQAVSDPQQVTLRWLRLGGIIALSLGAVAGVFRGIGGGAEVDGKMIALFGVTLATVVVQLVTVQLAWRRTQRIAAIAVVLLAAAAVSVGMSEHLAREAAARIVLDAPLTSVHVHDFDYSWNPFLLVPALLGGGILGGYLMTMLLGHAYLTAGNEMTQAPFRRLVLMLAILLALRTILSLAFGFWPYWNAEDIARSERLWNTVIITARYLVGLAVPAIFTYMTYDCVQRRANQSATGILYVAGVLVIIGEGSALALLNATRLVF